VVVPIGPAGAKSRIDDKALTWLQGSWVLVSGQVDGKPVPSKYVKQSRLAFSGRTISVYAPDRSKQTMREMLERLDPKKSPREMDWKSSTGPSKTTRAIYEVQGKRQFRICFDPTSDKRPTGFGGKASGCRVLHVWGRAKK
jgi:uncharacterized protein (TIGR03067 family)